MTKPVFLNETSCTVSRPVLLKSLTCSSKLQVVVNWMLEYIISASTFVIKVNTLFDYLLRTLREPNCQ